MFKRSSISIYGVVFTLLTVICGVSSQYESSIYIDNKNGEDNISCLTTKDIPCATLQYAIEFGLFNSSQFILFDETITLNSTLSIARSDSISFTSGNSSRSTILSCTIQNETTGAGILFKHVTNLHFSRLSFNNCGNILDSTTRDEDTTLKFRSALYILNSTNVTIEHVNFTNNLGIGLVIFDTNGFVSIHHCNFINNRVPLVEKSIYAGGGGLYIELTYCPPGKLTCDYQDNPYNSGSYYAIFNCLFHQNQASILPGRGITWVRFKKASAKRLGRGGGIAMTVKGKSLKNLFQIKNCTFINNSAEFGGALNIQIQDFSKHNKIEINGCKFSNNTSLNGGGGALFLGIFFYDCDCVFGNEIKFTNVDFIENRALYGGAIIFSSSRSKHQDRSNKVSFIVNTWIRNVASLGAAVLLSQEAWNAHALSSGYLPSPVFDECVFEENKIVELANSTLDDDGLVFQTTEGIVFSSSYSIYLTSSVYFFNNQGTAISVTAGFLNILENTTVSFIGNHGVRGGALALLGFASLHIFPGSVLNFTNNSATTAGGAIYASSSDDTDFYYSRSCFIVYSDRTKPDPKDWNTDLFFSGNKAGPCTQSTPQETVCREENANQYGNSIFATSISPCSRAANALDTPSYYFKQNPPFHFLSGMYISTNPATIFIGPADTIDSNTFKFSPGESRNLSLLAFDDMGNEIKPVYTASVRNQGSKQVEVDSSSLYVSDNTVTLTGEIGAEFQLSLLTVARRIVSLSINASLTNCPPGLIYSQVSRKCVCSETIPNKRYNGITKCSSDVFGAILDRGYWAGCSGENETILLTADCPFGYCRYNDVSKDNDTSLNEPIESTFFILPKTCDELDEFLCGGQNREGNLCGRCRENFSVYFHSQHFSCRECDNNIGILLYLLSEILPTALLCITILGFNIHLTSGLWSSAILFGQIIDFFERPPSNFEKQSQGLILLTNVYRFIYSSFNLDFFVYDDSLSFCLFKGATVMHVLLFKYITSLCAILILGILACSFQSACCNRCHKFWTRLEHLCRKGSARNRSWVINGIAALLVLSYAQCAKVSFQILSWTDLQREGGVPVKKIPLLSGELSYFTGEHAVYAVLALVVLFAAAILPLILLLYPVYHRVFSCCLGEQNHKISKFLTVMDKSFTKLKPLLDAFQGCYRDKFQFFAGLFFVYRFAVAACYAFSTNITVLTISLEIIIILMLGLYIYIISAIQDQVFQCR